MASILKANAPHATTAPVMGASGLASLNLQDLAESGRRQLDAVKQECERLLAAARAECAVIKQKAHDEGRQQGLSQAQQEIDQRVQQTAKVFAEHDVATLKAGVSQLWEQENQWLSQWQQSLVSLVVEITERLVCKKSDQDEQIVLNWATQAIDLTRSSRALVIAVHPETLVRVGDRLEQLLRTTGAPIESRIEPDETVSKNGVVVRQEGGLVDLQLRTQLERIAERLQ